MKSKDGVEEDCHEANAAKSPSFTATKLSHPQMLMFEHSEILTKVEARESHKENGIAERNSMNKTAKHHSQSVLHIAYNMSSRRKAMAALFSSRRKYMPLFCFQHSHSILATQKIRVLATRDQNPTGCSAAEESTTSHCIRSTLKKAYSETRN
jgi:hypothetical protein